MTSMNDTASVGVSDDETNRVPLVCLYVGIVVASIMMSISSSAHCIGGIVPMGVRFGGRGLVPVRQVVRVEGDVADRDGGMK